MARTKEKSLTFEQAIEQLEAITDHIESGDIGLADSLKQYEQGMKLIKRCRSMLDVAENRIASLSVDKDGELMVDGQEQDAE